MKKSILLLFSLALFCNKSFSQTGLYDQYVVQEIKIYFHEPDWDHILDSLKLYDLGYLQADSVIVNGTKLDSVGIKYKGNSSYDPTQVKNPFTIKFDKFVSGQNYQGYTSLKMANCYDDPSMIREVLAYSILKNYMHCPQSNYAKIYINDVLIGLYSNDEDINKSFVLKHFYSSANPFFKASPALASPAMKANLKYIDDNSSSYTDLYEKESSGSSGWVDFIALCDTITNSPSSLAGVMDIDRVIWMLAFDNILVNLDSYIGVFSQNYFIYKDNNGIWNPIIWDLNMAFGGFNFLGSPSNGMGTLALSDMQTLSPLAHSTHTDWPLINIIMQNDQYKRKYMAHYRTILNEMFANDFYKTLAADFQATIQSSVIADTNKFFSDAAFQNGMTQDVIINGRTVPGIANLMDARVAFLQSDSEIIKVAPDVAAIQLSSYTPSINDVVNITVSVTNADYVQFSYRSDSTLKFTSITLYDDGLHNDGVAGDFVYGGSIIITSNYTEYYVYTENNDAGIFFPARAEHEFYTLPGNPVTVGVNTLTNQGQKLIVYPNPAQEKITIQSSSNDLKLVKIYNILGHEVLQTMASGMQSDINLSDLSEGIYFVKATQNGEEFSHKIIIQR
ncbi:MAG: CotH kinase family protein [Bacteroidia bacterium]|nr:CotH kinase family protein [Bacteroidia bacterium]MCZ2247393.1 CotH kinase family protein [Bacteroidia bacterium]